MHNATPAASSTACAPWCKSHHHGDHPDDSYCRRTTTSDYGTIQLFPNHNGDPIIATYNVTRDEHTLDQAEEYFRAGLALVALARIGAAA